MQQELPFRNWGGKRDGAGRKPRFGRAGVAHRARPEHKGYEPVHVTMRAGRRLGSMRREAVFCAMKRAMRLASSTAFRVVHFAVQADHVHLMIEAKDKIRLSRGMAGLAIRLARAINRVLRRSGRVWDDRFHARALGSPREVRNALVYVIMNWRKHLPNAGGIDPCSSGFWFRGWKTGLPSMPPCDEDERNLGPPVRPPSTWLASTGWRRHGLIGLNERPKLEERPMPAMRG
jgi:REP element-mobilizing transposase RayT